MRLWALAGLCVPASWLLANHYLPWLSAWQDGAALFLGLLAALLLPARSQLPVPLLAFVVISACMIVVQALTGHIMFAGDAWVAMLYLLAALLALGTGWHLAEPIDRAADLLGGLAFTILVAAILSVGAALVQWTGSIDFGFWVPELRTGGRPFGFLAQPNHLSTICALGIVMAGLLNQRGTVGRLAFAMCCAWLVFGMALTGSRTGLVQALLASIALATIGRRSQVALHPATPWVWAAIYGLLVITLPLLSELLLLTGRPQGELAQGGTRPLHWAAMFEAIGRAPWVGYGWQQVSVAQVRTADSRPFVGEHIEHSHNIILDLVVWNGLPIGLLLAMLLLGWFVSRLRECRDGTACWLLIGVGCIAAHGMLEFPLEYAYFLIPLCFMAGAIERRIRPRRGIEFPIALQRGLAGLGLASMAWIAVEYLQAEAAHRTMRMEYARIGSPGLRTPPPDLIVLTQLHAFLRFAHTEARSGMASDELDWMRKVSERFAYPPVMFRYALAAGLNGRGDVATVTLARLCRMHPAPRCDEGREAWSSAKLKFPQLQGEMPLAMPR